MSVLFPSLGYLLFGGVLASTVLLVGVIVRHEHRAGMARIRGCSR